MNIKPIRNDDDHAKAVARAHKLWGSEVDTPKGDELSVLLLLINDYESKHHEPEPATPLQLIEFYMDQHDLQPKDLEEIFGSSGRVSEILHRKRPLSLKMIRKLAALDLDPATLIQEYQLVR